MAFKLTEYARRLIERQERKEKLEKEAAEKSERERRLAEEERRERAEIDRKRAESIKRNEEQIRKWDERRKAISEMQRRLEEKYGQSFLPGLGPRTSWGTSVPVGNVRAVTYTPPTRRPEVDIIPEGHLSSERIDAFENAEFKMKLGGMRR